MGKKWWEDPEIRKNIPEEMLESLDQAAESEHRKFDDTDKTPGDTGTPSSN